MVQSQRSFLRCFWSQVETNPDKVAVVQKRAGKWILTTWGALGEKVARFSSNLRTLGLKPGDKFAIYSDNCQEWLVADYAALSAGLVTVPIYPNLTEDQVRYIVEHSEASAVFVRGAQRLEKVKGLNQLKKIIAFEAGVSSADRVTDLELFLSVGSPEIRSHVEFVDRIDLRNIATIAYTSGTTAHPKGALLSFENIAAQMDSLRGRNTRSEDDVVLSYLPMSHITERLSQFRHAEIGYTLYFGGGFETLVDDLKHVRPTAFMGVPRVYEKFQDAILAKIQHAPPRKQAIFKRTLEIGKSYISELEKGEVSLKTRVRSRILQKLVGKKVRAGLGLDRAKRFYSGAAPLNAETAQFFQAIGMSITEGYGMTECAGASHLNHTDRPVIGTVGPSLDGFEFKLASDGEILIRSASVFKGYHKDPDATRQAIRSGWLHTGDIGVVDEKGCLKITDRIKNIIVTSAGKNIAPAPIEAKLKRHPKISQVVVVGDRRKFLTALVTLAPGVSAAGTRSEIQSHINQINATLPSYETIKGFLVLDRDFAVETGELTPTMKVKRSYIQEKYKSEIDGMYQAAQAA